MREAQAYLFHGILHLPKPLIFRNYTIFGGVKSSYAVDNFGVGTYDVDQLEDDIELRFTGVYDNGTNINGQTVYQIIEGGSYCYLL